MTIEKTIKERDEQYGGFERNAYVTQTLYGWVTQRGRRYGTYDWALEAVHMICHKLARVHCGGDTKADSWVDIVGYAKLARDLTSEKDFYIECNAGAPPTSLPEANNPGYTLTKTLAPFAQSIVYILFWQDLYLTYDYPAYWERIMGLAAHCHRQCKESI